jgi:hypothetical protein
MGCLQNVVKYTRTDTRGARPRATAQELAELRGEHQLSAAEVEGLHEELRRLRRARAIAGGRDVSPEQRMTMSDPVRRGRRGCDGASGKGRGVCDF